MPEGPFKHLVMDYIDMGKTIRKHRYVLVVVDRFSRWVEACPSPGPDSETVIQFFTREILPRFGIPEVVSSDNGKAFVEKTWNKIMQALGIKRRLGCVYHPQSQGMVERANGILKAKIAKICASSNLNWLDALPIALMHMRSQKNRITHLTPHEMLTGRVMPTPRSRGDDKGPSLEQLQREIRSYVQQLSLIHKTIYTQAKRQEPVNNPQADTGGPVKPGDWVFVKKFKRKSLQPRREGPYRVTQVTPTAVRVQGSSVWHHLNFCYRAIAPEESQTDVVQRNGQEQHEGDTGGAARAGRERGEATATGQLRTSGTGESESSSSPGQGLRDEMVEERVSGRVNNRDLNMFDDSVPVIPSTQDDLVGGKATHQEDQTEQQGASGPQHPWQLLRPLDPAALHEHPERAVKYQYDPLPFFQSPVHHHGAQE